MTLFSYVMPFDSGSAPNPFWGVCTLAICKPGIRRSAQVGNWVVGLGSASSAIGDIRGHVVYAMRVTEKVTMAEYDALTRRRLRGKVPDLDHRDRRRRAGDSIYDFAVDPPRQRPGRHGEQHLRSDLNGRFVLLSDEFWYFGGRPIALPPPLQDLCPGRAYRSKANAPFVAPFLEWLDSLGLEPGIHGRPQGWPVESGDVCGRENVERCPAPRGDLSC